MRSLTSTIALILASACLCGLAFWQWRHGDFTALLGAPPVPIGENLYPGLDPAEVREIRVSSASHEATFVKQPNGWHAITPWDDRMAPEAAVGIIQFAAGLRSEDYADRNDLDPEKSGLGKSTIRIRLNDEKGRSLADFRIGRSAPWKVELPDQPQPISTIYVQKLEPNHKQHIYVGSGDIGPLFKDGFKFLRDHQPFYFHPALLQSIRIRTEEGDLTLARKKPQEPWRIIKPLDLATDPASMKSLLEGLLSLRASRLADRAEVSITSKDDTARTNQIALTTFAPAQESILEILPPESPEARETKAIVNDRPKTVFLLPTKPEPGIITLANLPLSVNELRDPSLTHLHIPSLRAISIQPSTAPEILLSREPRQPWMVQLSGSPPQMANEENLYALLIAVTTGKALAFESDAATDFTPWGLDTPILTLRFLGTDNQMLELRFGINSRGDIFVNRTTTATVMRVDRSLLDAIAIRPHEWRHSALWSFNRFDLQRIERTRADEPTLSLTYDDFQEAWKGHTGEKDVTGDLNGNRANYMLAALEELRVTRWLPVGDSDAITALASPTLTLRIYRKKTDDDGNLISMIEDLLEFAPQPNSPLYYGRRLTEPQTFLIPRETYQKLSLDLLE
jgi:hypothetical protein